MSVYRRPDSPTFWMSHQINGARVRLNTQVTDRKVAESIFAAWRTEIAKTQWLGAPPPDHDHTIHELINEYRRTVTPSKSPDSQRRDRGTLARFDTEWGTRSLGELNAKMIDDYMCERQEEVTFATVSKELGIVKSAYRKALQWGWVSASPFTSIVLNQEGESRIRWLTDREEDRLLSACPAWIKDLVIVGLDTGLRRANLVGLQRTWLHDQGRVLIVPQRVVKGKLVTLTVPLTTRAAALIRRHLRTSASAYVFVQEDGHPYQGDQCTMAFGRAAKNAGFTDVCLYTLRHTFVSRLVQVGRPLPEVAALAGHRDIRMTMRYAHLAPHHLRDGIRALERGRRQPGQRKTHPTPS